MKQAVLDSELKRDMTLAKGRQARSEGLQYSVSKKALMQAVRSEGRQILTEEGQPWWTDQERKYPHMRNARTDTGNSLDGWRNRYGRVTYRARVVNGKLVTERREA